MPARKSIVEAGKPLSWVAHLREGEDRWEVEFPDLRVTASLTFDQGDMQSRLAQILNDAIATLIVARELIPAPVTTAKVSTTDWDIPLDHRIAMKALLSESMRVQNISQAELARRLNCDEKIVRRLLDPEENSRDRLAEALRTLNEPVAIAVVPSGRRTRSLSVPGALRVDPAPRYANAVTPSAKGA